MADLKIIGFAGSLRKDSYNRMLLRAARELAPEGMTIDIRELDEIPLYNEDVRAQGEPSSVQVLKEAIAEADAILIATPEYNHGVSGVLKNTIDWLSRPPSTSPLKGKPAAIMGATTGLMGTARAQEQLRGAFVFTETYAVLKPEILVTKAAERFDESGRLTDEPTREFVAKLLQALAEWTLRLQKGQA